MQWEWHFYRPPKELREGNVFTGIRLSFCSGDPHVIITNDVSLYRPHLPSPLGHQTWDPSLWFCCSPLLQTSDLEPLGPPLDIRPRTHPLLLTSGGKHWRPVKTCSLEDTPRGWHLVVVTETRTVCKWAVHILLECFPVSDKVHVVACYEWRGTKTELPRAWWL